MKHKEIDNSNFYSSKEAKAALKVQDCELVHIRNAGKLRFLKRGNAFMYSKDSVEAYVKKGK